MVDNSTTHQKQNKDLDMTGKPVLVQNELGIFYGKLEKADTRSGTALLRDGFMLSPERHITFMQYLNYLIYSVQEEAYDIHERFDIAIDESEDGQPEDDSMLYDPLLPNEVIIDRSTFNEHKRELTITDYASEGIYLVQHRTSSYENTSQEQSYAPLISLTNVTAIVTISSYSFYTVYLDEAMETIEQDGLLSSDSLLFLESMNPFISFMLISQELRAPSKFDEYYDRLSEHSKKDLEMSTLFHEIKKTLKFSNKKPKTDIKPGDIKSFIEEILKLPKIVVNSEKRSQLYKEKVAASNEQDS